MSTKQALTIGINAYVPSHLVLRSCLHDANDLSDSLRSIGFQVQNACDLNLKSMTSVTRQFVNSIQPGAVVLFYFSGHGVQCNGKNYLVPSAALGVCADNIESTTIDAQKLIDRMYQRRPRLIICVLDCCRTPAPVNPLDGLNLRTRALAGTRAGLAPMRPPPSTVVAYACAADDTASAQSRNGRNSLYTYYLLRYIKTPNVDVETVLKQVAADVQRDSNNKQIPYRYSSCNEIICLVSNQRQRAPAIGQFLQAKPVFQSPTRQRRKVVVPPRPDRRQNNVPLQLNGQFGLPVYQYLAMQNRMPYSQRNPMEYDFAVPKDSRHHQR